MKNTKNSPASKKPQKEKSKSHLNDENILEESYKIVKSLNEEVYKVQKAKEKLEKDVQQIGKKVEAQEAKRTPKLEGKVFDMLKDELIKELTPILKRFESKNIKGDLFKEIAGAIDVELKKIKSEVDSKSSKVKKDFDKKVSQLETRIVEALSNSEVVREQFKKFEEKEISKIVKDIENKVKKKTEDATRDVFNLNRESVEKIESLRLQLAEQKQLSKDFAKNVESIKSKLKKQFKAEEIDLSGIENKLLSLEKDNLAVKRLVEKYESELYNRKKNEEAEIEKRVGKVLTEAEKKLKALASERKAHDEFLINKVNEIVDSVNDFETKLALMEKKASKNMSASISEKFTKFKEKLLTDIDKRVNKHFADDKKGLSKHLKEFLKEKESIENELSLFKTEVKSLSRNYVKDMELELNKIKKESSEFSSDREVFIKKIEDKVSAESKLFESKLADIQSKVDESIKNMNNDNMSDREFLIEKLNEVIDNVNSFEHKLTELESQDFTAMDEKFTKRFISFGDKIREDFNKDFKVEHQKISQDLVTFKGEISELIKNYVDELDAELKKLKTETTRFNNDREKFINDINSDFTQEVSIVNEKLNNALETINKDKSAEREFMAEKYNSIVDKFKELDKNSKQLLRDELTKFKGEVDLKFIEKEKKDKEDFAKHIMSGKEFLTRIETEIKEEKHRLSEDVESKFINSKVQFEEEFRAHLKFFDTEIKEKESEFLSKLMVIEDDKKKMLAELNNFKEEIAKSTQVFKDSINQEFDKLKEEEVSFETQKQDFINEIDDLANARKQGFENFAVEIENKLKLVLEEEKETFAMHENTFREVFNEKINNLIDITKHRLDGIEHKFLDNSFKKFDEKVVEETKALELFAEKLESQNKLIVDKSIELDTKTDNLEKNLMAHEQNIQKREEKFDKRMLDKEDAMKVKLSEFESHVLEVEGDLKSKVEERLTQLEKQLNKRFLDYDGEFSNFKSVVVDEVEGLVKDVNKIIDSRVELVDKSLVKIKFIGEESVKKVNSLAEFKEQIHSQVHSLKEKLHSMEVKFDIMSSPQVTTISDHVSYMNEYENQLVALVKNLKAKGIPTNNIAHMLVNKGHPRFYVSVMLERFDEIYGR